VNLENEAKGIPTHFMIKERITMLENSQKEQIAATRYALIAPIVSRQTPLLPGELKKWLEETASHHYDIPGSQRQQVSVRTLERYIEAYRKGGWEALKPKERSTKGGSRLSPAVIEKAIQLRKERPQRSVEQLIFLLEESKIAPAGTIAVSTLSRHLRQTGMSRKAMTQTSSSSTFRRFEAEDILEILQSDFKHFVYLPDPENPKQKKKTILLAILDDYSRYIVHAQIYWDEKLPRLEDSLKKALIRHGIPETFYCDNGAAFSSHHLARICGKLGMKLVHSRPYRPQGRGKVERLFQFVDSSFLPEVRSSIDQGKLHTLDELNQALRSWMDGYYHERIHGSTKESPRQRFENSTRKRKRRSMVELNTLFLWEENRSVDKTGCVKLSGNLYEVDSELSGKQVALRYDPFDLSEIEVWEGDKRYADAKPVDLTRKRHKRAVKEAPPIVEPAGEQLSFFEIAEKKRQEVWQEEELRYAGRQGGAKG
jgi:transposase InsO family protein